MSPFLCRYAPRSFRRVLGVLALAVSLLGGDLANGQSAEKRGVKPRPPAIERPVLIEFFGPINGTRLRYLRSRLEGAKRHGADLVIVEFDSPGGELEASYGIAEMLRDVDWAYTVALCQRQALSGAALASFGCDELIVGPNARIGDIGVIRPDFGEFAFRFAPAKIVSDVVAFGRGLAEAKGRPPELIEAMIDKDVQVFTRIDAEGRRIFRTLRVGEENKLGAEWELIPESGPERFLELTGTRLVDVGLASQTVGDASDLPDVLNYPADKLRRMSFKTTDRLAAFFGHPFMVGLLIVVGTLALYFELSSPGIGIGGVIAFICAGLFFWSSVMGGTAGLLEILLFIGGVAFLLLELFVIPGWGITGLIGVLMILSSAVLAGQHFVIPRTTTEMNQFITTLATVLGAALVVLVGCALITRRVGQIPVLNQIVLPPPNVEGGDSASKELGNAKPAAPAHPIVSVGDWGQAVTVLRPAGRARFAGKFVDVVSDGDFVEPGSMVRVIQVQGAVVTVTPVVESDAARSDSSANPSKSDA